MKNDKFRGFHFIMTLYLLLLGFCQIQKSIFCLHRRLQMFVRSATFREYESVHIMHISFRSKLYSGNSITSVYQVREKSECMSEHLCGCKCVDGQSTCKIFNLRYHKYALVHIYKLEYVRYCL